RFLFPAAHDVRPLVGGYEDVKRELRLINPLLETDERQLETVVSILRQAPGSVPFIVYGPPGTGKTVTIVEAILQLLRADTSRNILVCAPSNVATDVLTERLAGGGLTTADMLRLNAFSRDIGTDCSDAVKTFTHACADADDVYAVPPLAQLVRYRVVLCTCSSASLLQTSGVPRGHFSHVFVDEAVYADEPTCVIPIKAVADEFTQIVLAGDPNQLQPVVMSNTAGKGLKRSYLQRLMSMKDIYGLPQQHGQTIVKLVRNRRSHPRIIAWSNKMFYEDELRAHADPVVVHSLLGSTLLPNKKFPVVFHGIKGEEKRSVSSSVFNVEEASLVKKYCKTLTEGPEHRVLAKDIGVVAPYKAQARRIRRLLKNARLKDVVVGSVEQFQGQERKVIIISTSRSSVDKEDAKAVEAKKSIGFIGEGRRMNVAFTRAKSMLVVIGDPNALGVSPLWRFFLNFVHRNGGCKGRPLGWKADEGVKLPDYVKEDVPLDQRAHGEEFMGGVRSYILRQRPPAR
ncbi:P-loop containing nucleoside triphosphate hydrolase protein, partial [Amylostereum chailletii]